MKTKKVTVMGLSVAVAMILSFVESQIPAFVAIPGVKMGLANIAVVFALYKLGWKEAAVISLIRVFLVSLLFGTGATLFYSVAGAVLSLLGMILLKATGLFSTVAVSVTGGVLHNVGQIAMACYLLGTNKLSYYLPFLMLSGILAALCAWLPSNLLQATAAAAWINGRAGELAQEKSSDISMTAGDTARALPEVFRLLRDQR